MSESWHPADVIQTFEDEAKNMLYEFFGDFSTSKPSSPSSPPSSQRNSDQSGGHGGHSSGGQQGGSSGGCSCSWWCRCR